MVTAIRVPIREQRDASYDVVVGRGALEELPALLADRCAAHRYALVADHRVAELHGTALLERLAGAGLTARLHTFPAGEWNKTRETWAHLADQLLAARFGRDSAVIAFGGGVAGDLAGFLAATYLRGVPWVQVPTTLLAMIDASIGGKTGVDVPAGKNLIGCFHQPRCVVADVALLATLPRVQLAAGAAEAVKHAVIADPVYAQALRDGADALLQRDLEVLEPLVRRSIEIKTAVVARDEREAGVRQVLNFGHTVGHAIEARTGFELLHGEAVAIGMAVEAHLAEAMGVAEPGLARDVMGLLECFQLPLTLPETITADELLEGMLADKKVRGGHIRCALPTRVGAMAQGSDGEWTVAVELDTLRRVLETNR